MMLKSDSSFATTVYYMLAKLHFRLVFGVELEDHVVRSSILSDVAQNRHARLVVSTLYKGSDKQAKRRIRAAARGAFVRNIILTAKV